MTSKETVLVVVGAIVLGVVVGLGFSFDQRDWRTGEDSNLLVRPCSAGAPIARPPASRFPRSTSRLLSGIELLVPPAIWSGLGAVV